MRSNQAIGGIPVGDKKYLLLIAGLFCGIFVSTIMLSAKIVTLYGLTFPASIILLPATFLFGDVLTEVYGYHVTRQVVWAGLASQVVWIGAFTIAAVLPPAAFWTLQDSFVAVLGSTPRIAAAGMTAYVVGEFLNSYVLAKMKVRQGGRHLAARLIGSTVVGAGADTAIVLFIAFAGVYPAAELLWMGASVWALKVAWEVAALPISLPFIRWLKRVENEDHFDVNTDFSPFALGASEDPPIDASKSSQEA